MHRIAAAFLIAAAVLALNGGMLREAFAEDLAVRAPAAGVAAPQQIASRSAKVLSLLLILEALRQSPVAMDRQKV